MSNWMLWGILSGFLVILELFSGTFYLLMIALGFAAGAFAAVLDGSLATQLLVAAIVGCAATLALHRSKYGWKGNQDVACDPNVNMDIGQTLQVQEWQDAGNGKYSARAMYRGAMWDIELRQAHGVAGMYVIEQVRGNRLIVRPV